MLSALERGRTPSVDFLNGEVVDRAAAHGISVPVNAKIQAMIHQIAGGRQKSSYDLLRRLYDETRLC